MYVCVCMYVCACECGVIACGVSTAGFQSQTLVGDIVCITHVYGLPEYSNMTSWSKVNILYSTYGFETSRCTWVIPIGKNLVENSHNPFDFVRLMCSDM